MAQWYFIKKGTGQQQGPVPVERIRTMMQTGHLVFDDWVWNQSMPEWQPLEKARDVIMRRPEAAQPAEPSLAMGGGMGGQPQLAMQGAGAAPMDAASLAVLEAQADGWTGPRDGFSRGEVNLNYAGFFQRFGAYFMDCILINLCFWAAAIFLTMGAVKVFGEDSAAVAGVGMLLYLVLIAFPWLYFALQESGEHSATLGKRAGHLMVVTTEGDAIGFGRATGRHLAKVISALPCGMGFVMAMFTPKKQALHDMIAGTVVIARH